MTVGWVEAGGATANVLVPAVVGAVACAYEIVKVSLLAQVPLGGFWFTVITMPVMLFSVAEQVPAPIVTWPAPAAVVGGVQPAGTVSEAVSTFPPF